MSNRKLDLEELLALGSRDALRQALRQMAPSILPQIQRLTDHAAGLAPAMQELRLAGCGKSRDFGETVMKRARNGNPGLIKSTGYEGAKGDESGWKHHRPTFSAAC